MLIHVNAMIAIWMWMLMIATMWYATEFFNMYLNQNVTTFGGRLLRSLFLLSSTVSTSDWVKGSPMQNLSPFYVFLRITVWSNYRDLYSPCWTWSKLRQKVCKKCCWASKLFRSITNTYTWRIVLSRFPCYSEPKKHPQGTDPKASA